MLFVALEVSLIAWVSLVRLGPAGSTLAVLDDPVHSTGIAEIPC